MQMAIDVAPALYRSATGSAGPPAAAIGDRLRLHSLADRVPNRAAGRVVVAAAGADLV
jgi:hypothetical protein